MIIPCRLPRSPRLLGVMAFVAACRTAAPPGADAPVPRDRPMNAEALLAELNPRGGAAIVQAWSGTEPESVAVHYAEDALLVVDAQTLYRGRGEILEGFLRPLVGNISGLMPTIDRVVGGPEQMTLIGRFTTRVNVPGGEPIEASGVFGNTWALQPDGSWKIVAAINDRPTPLVSSATAHRDTTPRDAVRIVRFTVKPDQRTAFERFFREDLLMAAARRQGVPAEALDLSGFRLLVPSAPTGQGYFTYYIISYGGTGALGTGEVMRDMVREAFPGEEGVRRVQRWMATMVLEEPYRPVGETFTEADLLNRTPQRD
jgi:ketosteroid isomerase-like protein